MDALESFNVVLLLPFFMLIFRFLICYIVKAVNEFLISKTIESICAIKMKTCFEGYVDDGHLIKDNTLKIDQYELTFSTMLIFHASLQ